MASKSRARRPYAKRKPPEDKRERVVAPPNGPREQKPRDKRLTPIERVLLMQRVAAARSGSKPDPWTAISGREGIPVRTLQWHFREFLRETAKVSDATGAPVLDETLLLYAEAIENLSHEMIHGDSSTARVGASRALLDVLKQRIELLAVMGRMPRNFRALEELGMLMQLVRRFGDLLERHQVDPAVVQEFIALVDEVQPVIDGEAEVRSLAQAS